MKLKPIFRLATKTDAEGIAELHARVYGQPACIKSLREAWQKDTDGRGGKAVHICVNNNKIVGAIFSRPKTSDKKSRPFSPNKVIADREIVSLFVDPKFQHDLRKKENPRIGRRLLIENLRISDEINANTVLSVSNDNAAAKHLYATLGFKIVPQKKKNQKNEPTTCTMMRPHHPKID